MGLYAPEPFVLWNESLKLEAAETSNATKIMETDTKLDDMFGEAHHETLGPSQTFYQESNNRAEKSRRRLAQNREAARRSRLRKKVYIQQLESSRIKLEQLEQELAQAKRQVLCSRKSSLALTGQATNSGIMVAFEVHYAHWVEEQNRQTYELSAALRELMSDEELSILVESVIKHYESLFTLKAIAAESDVFFVMSGMWRTASERFFLWIGGFRPSNLLKIVTPLLSSIPDEQLAAVDNLQQSSMQAEDALSQGLERLQHTLAESLMSHPFDTSDVSNYRDLLATEMGKLKVLVSFIEQADHLRMETLHRMTKILTTRHAAECLLALGNYFWRLRELNSLSAPPSCESTNRSTPLSPGMLQ